MGNSPAMRDHFPSVKWSTLGRMDERLRKLVEPALSEAAASEANLEITRARRAAAGGDPDDEDAPSLRSYELVLDTWLGFVQDQLPRLVYHLESVRAPLPEARGVLVAAFLGDKLYFVLAQEFIGRVARQLAVTPGELAARYGTGESKTAVQRGPLLLPGPKD